jgi:hypothetical protein
MHQLKIVSWNVLNLETDKTFNPRSRFVQKYHDNEAAKCLDTISVLNSLLDNNTIVCLQECDDLLIEKLKGYIPQYDLFIEKGSFTQYLAILAPSYLKMRKEANTERNVEHGLLAVGNDWICVANCHLFPQYAYTHDVFKHVKSLFEGGHNRKIAVVGDFNNRRTDVCRIFSDKFVPYFGVTYKSKDIDNMILSWKCRHSTLVVKEQACSDHNPIVLKISEGIFPKNYHDGMKFKDWILPHTSKLSLKSMCKNRSARLLLEKLYSENPHNPEFDWNSLSENPAAINILEKEYTKKPCRIVWSSLALNPSAMSLIKKHVEQTSLEHFLFYFWTPTSSRMVRYSLIPVKELCSNPAAIEYVEQVGCMGEVKNFVNMLLTNQSASSLILESLQTGKLALSDLNTICLNTDKKLCNAIVRNNCLDCISEKKFFANPSYIDSITKMVERGDQVDWSNLCRNPLAGMLIEDLYAKDPSSSLLHWDEIFKNPSCENIIKKELGRQLWQSLSENPAIFG